MSGLLKGSLIEIAERYEALRQKIKNAYTAAPTGSDEEETYHGLYLNHLLLISDQYKVAANYFEQNKLDGIAAAVTEMSIKLTKVQELYDMAIATFGDPAANATRKPEGGCEPVEQPLKRRPVDQTVPVRRVREMRTHTEQPPAKKRRGLTSVLGEIQDATKKTR